MTSTVTSMNYFEMANPGKSELPFDIISEVLSQACTIIPVGFTDQPNFISSPLYLCQVCRSWNAFLKGTSAFWATVVIKLALVPLRGTKVSQDGLEKWVERAGDRLLDVYISGVNADVATQLELNEFVLRLATLSHRWRSFELHLINAQTAAFLQDSVTKHSKDGCMLPLLQSFRINSSTLRFGPQTLRYFAHSTQLHTLDFSGLSGDSLRYCYHFHTVPCITSLTLQNTADIPPHMIFQWFPLLQTADFSNLDSSDHDYTVAIENFTHHHLQSFTIEAGLWAHLAPMLNYLQAPSLERFSVSLAYTGQLANVTPHIKSFLERSGCNLHYLYLHLPIAHKAELNAEMEADIVLLLAQQLELVHLHLRLGRQSVPDLDGKKGLTEAFFEALQDSRPSNIPYLPHLRQLSYEGPLAINVKSLEFLRPLVLRLLPNSQQAESIVAAGSEMDIDVESPSSPPARKIARLVFAKIKADQLSCLLPKNLDKAQNGRSLALQLKGLVESDVLWLMNRNFATFWSL